MIALLIIGGTGVWWSQRRPDVRLKFGHFEKRDGIPVAIFILENRSSRTLVITDHQLRRVRRPTGWEEEGVRLKPEWPIFHATMPRGESASFLVWAESRETERAFREPFQAGVQVGVPNLNVLGLVSEALPKWLARALPQSDHPPKVLTYWSEVVTP